MNRKILAPIAAFSLATALAYAQDPTISNSLSNSNAAQTTTSSPDEETTHMLMGCLVSSTGTFSLKDTKTGTVYNLIGNVGDLASRVGHELEVTGQLSTAPGGDSTVSSNSTEATSSAISSSSGSSTTTGATFQVSQVNDVADHCSAAVGSSLSPGSSAPRVSEDPNADASSTAASAQVLPHESPSTNLSTAASSSDSVKKISDLANGSASSTPQPSSETAAALPETASPVPLLGLFGVGLLVVGRLLKRIM